jgi:hypothetical protein
MSNLPPIPQDQIGENFKWRDWFRSLASYVSGGASGSFKTSDVPSKTVTVVNGIITSIK